MEPKLTLLYLTGERTKPASLCQQVAEMNFSWSLRSILTVKHFHIRKIIFIIQFLPENGFQAQWDSSLNWWNLSSSDYMLMHIEEQLLWMGARMYWHEVGMI